MESLKKSLVLLKSLNLKEIDIAAEMLEDQLCILMELIKI